MKAAKALMMGLGASGGGLYVGDVFSTYVYKGVTS